MDKEKEDLKKLVESKLYYGMRVPTPKKIK